MAGPFYVDISDPGAWNGRTGLDTTTNCLRGFTGLQWAFDNVAVGEICYVKGSASNLEKFYNVPYDADNDTTLTDGEGVSWHDGTGVVHIVSTTATSPGNVEMELLTGNIPTDGDTITGATSGGTITAHTTIAQKGLDVDTKSGTNAGGYIKFIGCKDDAGFTVDGTRCIIDGNSTSANGLNFGNGADLVWFQNFEVQECTYGIIYGAYYSEGYVFINFCSHNNAANGFRIASGYPKWVSFIRCTSYLNGGSGFYLGTSTDLRFYFCCSYSNTGRGFEEASPEKGNLIFGCVTHANTTVGFEVGSGTKLINCVADGNLTKGVFVISHTNLDHTVILGCRITNQSGAGDIGVDAGNEILLSGWNYFENNADANVQNTGAYYFIPLDDNTTSILEDAASQTDTGYVDSATHDFSTDYTSGTDPVARRTAITVPWT
jgi:hypothetical protein